MEIILLETIENLGKFWNKKIVKNGYARNYLIPKEKAIILTEKIITKQKTKIKEINEKKQEKIINNLKKYELIVNKKIQIQEKATKTGILYGSLGKTQLIEKLNNIGIDVNKKDIVSMDDKIKNLGKYIIKFHFTPGDIIFKKAIYILKSNE